VWRGPKPPDHRTAGPTPWKTTRTPRASAAAPALPAHRPEHPRRDAPRGLRERAAARAGELTRILFPRIFDAQALRGREQAQAVGAGAKMLRFGRFYKRCRWVGIGTAARKH